jgi:spore maturation protein CgeB
MRIAFFGSSLVSAYWNGAATYYRGIIRALAARGFEITFYEPDAFDRQKHRDMADPPWARSIVYPANEEGLFRVLEKACSADIIVKASGVGIFDDLLETGVLALQRSGTRVIYWDVDAPATLDRLAQNPADPLRALLPRYDLVLTYGGGDPVVQAFRALGVRDCIPIYNALDTTTHFPVPPQPRFTADLTFIGNRLPDREARVESFFLRAAMLRPTKKFLLGGSGWSDKPLPANVDYLGHVYTADHNAMNSSALAVLNINRESMARYGFSPPTRVFEAVGAGACLLTDAWQGIEQFLEPGREVLTAASGDEVAAHLDALTPERASAIGRAALRRVRAEHTYEHRADFLDSLLRGGLKEMRA